MDSKYSADYTSNIHSIVYRSFQFIYQSTRFLIIFIIATITSMISTLYSSIKYLFSSIFGSLKLVFYNPIRLLFDVLWFGFNLPLTILLYSLNIELNSKFMKNVVFMSSRIYEFMVVGIFIGVLAGVYTGLVLISIKYLLSPKNSVASPASIPNKPAVGTAKSNAARRSEFMDILNQVTAIPNVNDLNKINELNRIEELKRKEFKIINEEIQRQKQDQEQALRNRKAYLDSDLESNLNEVNEFYEDDDGYDYPSSLSHLKDAGIKEHASSSESTREAESETEASDHDETNGVEGDNAELDDSTTKKSESNFNTIGTSVFSTSELDNSITTIFEDEKEEKS